MNINEHEGDFIGADGLTRKQAAALLHITPDSFSAMQSRGELNLEYVEVGQRKRIYSRRQIMEYLRSRHRRPEVAA